MFSWPDRYQGRESLSFRRVRPQLAGNLGTNMTPMNRLQVSIIVSLCVVCGAAIGVSQTTQVDWKADPRWTRLYDYGLTALVSDQYRVAADSLEVALERAKKYSVEDPRLRLTLERLAEVYERWGRLVELESIRSELTRLPMPSASSNVIPGSTHAKDLMFSLEEGWKAYARRDFEAARELALRGLRAADSLGQPHNIVTAGCVTLMGATCLARGDVEGAISWSLKPIGMAALDGDGQQLAGYISNFRTNFRLIGVDWIDPILDSCEDQASGQAATADSARMAGFRIYDLMGRLAESKSNPKSAEEYFGIALALADSINPNSKMSGAALNSLGMALLDQDRIQEAREKFIRALEIFSSLKPNLPGAVATPLNNLGMIAVRENDLRTADTLLSKSVQVMQEAGVESQPRYTETLNSLAVVAMNLNQMERARKLVTDAMHFDSLHRGTSHLDFARDCLTLGSIRLTQGLYKDAEMQLKRSIALTESHAEGGPVHMNALKQYSDLLKITFREREAKELDETRERLRELAADTSNGNR